MRQDKNPTLANHFQRLKEVLPEVYQQRQISESEQKHDRMVTLLKHSLGVIEAVYLQNPDNFSPARVEAYASIVSELNSLGVIYSGNAELIGRAAGMVVLQAKMPMERAGRRTTTQVLAEKKAM